QTPRGYPSGSGCSMTCMHAVCVWHAPSIQRTFVTRLRRPFPGVPAGHWCLASVRLSYATTLVTCTLHELDFVLALAGSLLWQPPHFLANPPPIRSPKPAARHTRLNETCS